MKLEINNEKLKRAVLKLRNSLPDVSVNPILEHILFEVKDSVLTLKSTNNLVSIIWTTPIDIKENFSFTIHGETLCGLVSSFKQDTVIFDYNPETRDVTLSYGKYILEAVSGNTSNYPVIDIPEKLKEFKLPNNFLTMLKSVYFSISNDATKPDLNSLCIDINKDSSGKFSLVSTDRIRLSCASTNTEFDKSKAIRFILPKSSVSEIIKMEPTLLLYDENLSFIYFKIEGEQETYFLRSVLTNFIYPDIYAYLNNPYKDEQTIKVNKNDLITSLKRIRLTTEKTNKIGTLEFKEDKAVVSSLNSMNKSKEEISLILESIEKKPNNFNMNIDHVLEYLSQEIADTVNFRVIDNKCIIFDKENYRHVLSINS